MKMIGVTVMLFACAPLEQCINPACWGYYGYPYSRQKIDPEPAGSRAANFRALSGKYTTRTILSDGVTAVSGTGRITIALRRGDKKALVRATGDVLTPVGPRSFSMALSLQKNKTTGSIVLPGLGSATGAGSYTGRRNGLDFVIEAPVADTVATVSGTVRKRGKKLTLAGQAGNAGGTMAFTFTARQKK